MRRACNTLGVFVLTSVLACGCAPPRPGGGSGAARSETSESDQATPLFPVSEGYIDKTGKLVLKRERRHKPFSEGLAPVKGFWGKWGYIDKRNKVVIPCRFSSCGPFSEGLAPVKNLWGKWGYVDKRNTVVIPCRFSSCGPFSQGLAAVWVGDEPGYIDTKGNSIISLDSDCEVSPFAEGFAYIRYRGEKRTRPQ